MYEKDAHYRWYNPQFESHIPSTKKGAPGRLHNDYVKEKWDLKISVDTGKWMRHYQNLRSNDYYCHIDYLYPMSKFHGQGLGSRLANFESRKTQFHDTSAESKWKLSSRLWKETMDGYQTDQVKTLCQYGLHLIFYVWYCFSWANIRFKSVAFHN